MVDVSLNEAQMTTLRKVARSNKIVDYTQAGDPIVEVVYPKRFAINPDGRLEYIEPLPKEERSTDRAQR